MGSTHVHDLATAPPIQGLLPRLDPRARILAALAIVLGVVLAPPGDGRRLAAHAFVILVLAAFAGPPLPAVVLRGAVVVPFAVFAGIAAIFHGHDPVVTWHVLGKTVQVFRTGLLDLGDLVARAWLSTVAFAAVVASGDESDVVRGLEGLHVPRLLVVTIGFTIRYLRTLAEESSRMRLAREQREFRSPSALRSLVALGRSIGTLFVRTYDRAERIHAAMVARGFSGRVPSLRARPLAIADVLLVVVCAGAAAGIHLAPLERWIP
jgi:cobalt/nickel transport system permease protein